MCIISKIQLFRWIHRVDHAWFCFSRLCIQCSISELVLKHVGSFAEDTVESCPPPNTSAALFPLNMLMSSEELCACNESQIRADVDVWFLRSESCPPEGSVLSTCTLTVWQNVFPPHERPFSSVTEPWNRFNFGIMMFKTGGLLRKTAVIINYFFNLAFDLSQ